MFEKPAKREQEYTLIVTKRMGSGIKGVGGIVYHCQAMESGSISSLFEELWIGLCRFFGIRNQNKYVILFSVFLFFFLFFFFFWPGPYQSFWLKV